MVDFRRKALTNPIVSERTPKIPNKSLANTVTSEEDWTVPDSGNQSKALIPSPIMNPAKSSFSLVAAFESFADFVRTPSDTIDVKSLSDRFRNNAYGSFNHQLRSFPSFIVRPRSVRPIVSSRHGDFSTPRT